MGHGKFEESEGLRLLLPSPVLTGQQVLYKCFLSLLVCALPFPRFLEHHLGTITNKQGLFPSASEQAPKSCCECRCHWLKLIIRQAHFFPPTPLGSLVTEFLKNLVISITPLTWSPWNYFHLLPVAAEPLVSGQRWGGGVF